MKLQEKKELQAKIKELQEQVDNAVIENDNPFNVKNGELGYINNSSYNIGDSVVWDEFSIDYSIPCKDRSIVEARQKRHHLADLLEKFAYDNDAVVTEEMWEDTTFIKYCIYKRTNEFGGYDISKNRYTKYIDVIYFTSKEVAQRAINEVVIPFNNGTL